MTEWFQLGKFLGVLFLFAGFLVSIEVFHQIRVPFTSIRLGRARHEPAGAEAAGGRGRGSRRRARRGRGGQELTPRARPAAARADDRLGGPTMAAMPPSAPTPTAEPRSTVPRWCRRPPVAGGSRSSSWRRRCSGCSGRCRASPTTPGCSRWRSSPGAARSARSATAVFVAWRIRRGTERIDPARRSRPRRPAQPRGRGADGLHPQPRDVHRVRPRHGRARAARLLHLPGHGRGGRTSRSGASRSTGRGWSPSAWRSPGWSRWSPRSSTRRPGSGSMPSGSGWRSARR